MRRAFVMLAGLALAIPSAMAMLALAILCTEINDGGLSPARALDFLLTVATAPDPGSLLRAVFRGLAVTCCLPVVTIALIGEVGGLSSKLFYMGASAALSLALPLAVAHGANAGAIVSPTVMAPLLLAGGAAGAVYAIVAGPDDRRLMAQQATPPIPSGDA